MYVGELDVVQLPIGGGGRPRPSPSNLRWLWGLPLLLITATCVLFIIASVMESVPARGMQAEPFIPINEGGAACFAPNSRWDMLRSHPVAKMEDAVHMGGMSSKSLVSFEGSSEQAMWKPQLPLVNHHKSSPFNAVIAFHTDCLLGLQRVPPSAAVSVDADMFRRSISDLAAERMAKREVDWAAWMRDGAYGAAQAFIPGVVHKESFVVSVEEWAVTLGMEAAFHGLVGFTVASEREEGQRDMFDYILANWDRGHNQFHVTGEAGVPPAGAGRSAGFSSPARVRGQEGRTVTSLVYLDYDHLRLAPGAPTVLDGQLKCRFYRRSVARLAELHSHGFSQALQKSLEQEAGWEAGLEGSRRAPVEYIDIRAGKFLEHVALCVEKYGEEYVLGL